MKRTDITRLLAVAVSSAVLLGSTAASASLITPTLVVGGAKVNQIYPSANDTHVIWTENSAARPKHYDAVSSVLPPTGSPTRMNQAGSLGFTGNITNGTSEAIYQEVANHASNLYLYDVSTDVRTDPPAGVNTSAWEWKPSISAGFMEFGRSTATFKPRAKDKVVLYDRNAHTSKVLATLPEGCLCIYAEQVSDEYATWIECPNICRVWYYDIAADKVHQLKDPRGLWNYAPSIDGTTGALYFVQSGDACGLKVKLMRWSIGSPIDSATVVSKLPSGYDVGDSRVTVTLGGDDDVYFSRQKCGGKNYSDIYKVAAANTASPVASRVGTGPAIAAGTSWSKQPSRADAPSSYPSR
jgi:hypothetical protein